MEKEILDQDLIDFCQWFKDHFGKAESYECAMLICLCGHYHTFPKQAKGLLSRMVGLGLAMVKKHIVYLK